jgi:O-antigen ligase
MTERRIEITGYSPPHLAWQAIGRWPVQTRSTTDRVFLAMVAVLPLHTVFLSAWISWKPFLVLLVVIIVADIAAAVRERAWPYHRTLSIALLAFGLLLLTGYPAAPFRERFFQLGLAIAVGAMVMLVTERRLRRADLIDDLLTVVFWTGAAMGVTAVLLSLVNFGVFGADAVNAINEVPGIFRTSKPAYLESGFIALTNWHQDPGYGAAWSVLWAVLALVAAARRPRAGLGIEGAVIGGLAFAVLMAFSRTGWLALPIGLTIVGVSLVRAGWVDVAWITKRLGIAAAVAITLTAFMFVVDPPEVAGDVDLQFAFRLSQGWDLLADITGLFERSDVAFGDRFEPSEERADVWPEYWDMFTSNPLLGVGLGVGWLTNSILQEPHNLALELLAETGLVGLGAFLAVMVVIVRSGRSTVAGALLAVTFLPAMTQTVLFEPTWWFAAGIYLSGALAGVVTAEGERRLSSQTPRG